MTDFALFYYFLFCLVCLLFLRDLFIKRTGTRETEWIWRGGDGMGWKGRGREERRGVEEWKPIIGYILKEKKPFSIKKILQYTSERFCSVLNKNTFNSDSRILFCLLLID